LVSAEEQPVGTPEVVPVAEGPGPALKKISHEEKVHPLIAPAVHDKTMEEVAGEPHASGARVGATAALRVFNAVEVVVALFTDVSKQTCVMENVYDVSGTRDVATHESVPEFVRPPQPVGAVPAVPPDTNTSAHEENTQPRVAPATHDSTKLLMPPIAPLPPGLFSTAAKEDGAMANNEGEAAVETALT
jgi:hypothetical protein